MEQKIAAANTRTHIVLCSSLLKSPTAKSLQHLLSTCLQCWQDAEAYNQRNMQEEGGGGYIAYVWDCAYWGTQIKLSQFTNNAAYASEVSCHGPSASLHCLCQKGT